MKVKEESEKAGLKLNIQKTKIMHPDPSLPGKKKGKKWKQWQTFILLGSKITADGDCSKETLAPWKKSCDKPRQHIKSKDITLPVKVYVVKGMVFPVVM